MRRSYGVLFKGGERECASDASLARRRPSWCGALNRGGLFTLCCLIALTFVGCACVLAPSEEPLEEREEERGEGQVEESKESSPQKRRRSRRPRRSRRATLQLPGVSAASDARVLHEETIVADMHVDTLWKMHKKRLRFTDGALEAGAPRLGRSGVDVQFFSIWVPPDIEAPRREAMALVKLFEEQVLEPNGPRTLARSAQEAVALHRRGKPVALLGLEGAEALEGDPSAVDAFHERGVGYVALTWNEQNAFASGVKGEGGLTAIGFDLLRRLNDRKIMVDVSHANKETFWDVVTHSRRPVIASHSNAMAVHEHPRNLDDLQIWALAASGGVIGLNFHSPFVAKRRASLRDLVAHVRHLRSVGGDEVLALGTDFDGGIQVPQGLVDIGVLDRLTVALWRDGMSEQTIAGLLGHNLLRSMNETMIGERAQRVTHRPAAVAAVSGQWGVGEREAFDGLTTTSWKAPKGEFEGLRVMVQGPGVDQIAVCGSSLSRVSAVRRLALRVYTERGDLIEQVELDLSSDLKLHRVSIPAASTHVRMKAELEVVGAVEGPKILSEVVFERRPGE